MKEKQEGGSRVLTRLLGVTDRTPDMVKLGVDERAYSLLRGIVLPGLYSAQRVFLLLVQLTITLVIWTELPSGSEPDYQVDIKLSTYYVCVKLTRVGGRGFVEAVIMF